MSTSAAVGSTMVSSDSHVIEPPDLFRPLLAEFGERAPRVERDADGLDWWWVDAQRINSFAGGSQAGARFDDPDSLVLADSVDNVRSAVWSPDRYVADNLDDGVGASVLYPTQQMQHYAVRDTSLVNATCRVYNDWLADFCALHPDRLFGVAALNVDDPAVAAAEIERAANLGLAGAMVPVSLPGRHSYAERQFEPVWRAAAEAGLPLSLHIGTYRADPRRSDAVVIAGAQRPEERPVQSAFATADLAVRSTLADLIYGGVLERHPDLRVVSAEHEIGWLPHFVERLDYTYTQRATRGHRFADGALPSDFISRQVWVQFCEDPHAAHAIASVGSANVLWGSDYPHSEGTFPRSQDLVADRLRSPGEGALGEGAPGEAARHQVLVSNPASLYGIDPAVLAR